MKKSLITLILILTLTSGCRKESGCGVVRGGDYEINLNNDYSYFLWIQFDGSSRSRRVYVDYKTFIDYRIGDKICFN
jgi:hypothetical protein